MPDIYTAIGTIVAAAVTLFGLIYTIHIKSTKDKFNIVFDRLHEHDLIIARFPSMASDLEEVKKEVHELNTRFSELAQGVARIEGKLEVEEK